MKVTMKIKVYALLMMSVAMAGNMAVSDVDVFEAFFGNDEVVLAHDGNGEDDGWHAEEFDSMLHTF
ncbi:MAG: hypothetical protein JEZ08_01450 [Clostridiales bacterium]|nr:hypothetical protein [Clostridiales bacterium]